MTTYSKRGAPSYNAITIATIKELTGPSVSAVILDKYWGHYTRIEGGFCGDLGGGRTAARLSSHRYLRATRRFCLAEHCSGLGSTAGSGIGSDLAAANRRALQLLPRCLGCPSSLSRRKRGNSHPFTRRRLVFSTGALCSCAVQCRKSWSSGNKPPADFCRRRRRSKRLDRATGMGET